MADNDIYDNKRRYERFVAHIDDLAIPLTVQPHRRGASKYWCRNAANLAYFRLLIPHFDACDLSYVRRMRLFRTLIAICDATAKDLKECAREDINAIVAKAHANLPAVTSRRDLIKDMKCLWRVLFPERDEQGRLDETLIPYAVRHLSTKIDKSKERLRDEKLTLDEYERLLQAFSLDKRIQAFLALSLKSLRRPQELLYTRIRDMELHDTYAKVLISSHGKEGPGLAQCIDSFPYLAGWFNEHPLRHDPNAFLFINLGSHGRYEQLRPETINKHLRQKLKLLRIPKRITCYSFKRNGVTLRRLRGDSDVSIQRAAGWSSTRQIRTYDLSDAEDAFKIELVKRGILKDKRYEQFQPSMKTCGFCSHANGVAEAICSRCKRPLDRKAIEAEATLRGNEREQLQAQLSILQSQFSQMNTLMNRLVAADPELLDVLARRVVALEKPIARAR